MYLVRLFCLLIAFSASNAFAQVDVAPNSAPDFGRDCTEMRSARNLLAQKSTLLSGPEVARIDVHSEYSAFNLAALKLRTLARFGRCDLHLTEVDENFVVRSDDGISDQFEVLGPAREVISWKHSRGSDSPRVVHFSSRGEVDPI